MAEFLNAFNSVIKLTRQLDRHHMDEAYTWLRNDGVNEFLKFITDNGSITTPFRQYLIWELFNYEFNGNEYANYYEADEDKLNPFTEVFGDNIDEIIERYELLMSIIDGVKVYADTISLEEYESMGSEITELVKLSAGRTFRLLKYNVDDMTITARDEGTGNQISLYPYECISIYSK